MANKIKGVKLTTNDYFKYLICKTIEGLKIEPTEEFNTKYETRVINSKGLEKTNERFDKIKGRVFKSLRYDRIKGIIAEGPKEVVKKEKKEKKA